MTPAAQTITDQLLDILSQYVSRINAQGLLSRSIHRNGASGPPIVDERNLPQVLQRLQASAGLFIPTEHRQDFRRRLEGLRLQVERAAPKPESETIPIEAEGDIVVARTRARIMCENLGAAGVSTHKVATVVSELARNIISYTPGGSVELTPELSPLTITIQAKDRGAGIRGLNSIMDGSYRSKTGLGLGLSGSKRLADNFHIDTGPNGTTVVVRMKV